MGAEAPPSDQLSGKAHVYHSSMAIYLSLGIILLHLLPAAALQLSIRSVTGPETLATIPIDAQRLWGVVDVIVGMV